MSYELILAAARSRDIAVLTDVLKRTTIDVWKPRQIHYSAISQLAQEKDKYAVDFLLQQGASLHCAALGAALSGDRAYCAELIKQGANRNYVILGAVLGNHEGYCKELLAPVLGSDEVYCEEPIVRGAGLNWAILGAALGYKRTYCDMLIGQCAGLDDAIQSEGLEYAAMGAALGGDRAYCDELIARGANINKAALYAALGGHYAYCEELIAQGANLNDVALGAARGGAHAYCKELVERGASLHYVAEGAAMGGYRAYCEELIALKAWLIFYVAMGAAMGGHRTYCEELIALDAKLIGYVAKGAARCGNHAYCNELIQRGAHPNYAAEGAAESRYHRYCEELLTAGANIGNAVRGAASGGDRVYCDIFINRVSDGNRDGCLKLAAYGAMQGGHYTYFESLIQQLTKRGVGLQDVAHELARSRIFETEAATFYFLLHFENASFRKALIDTLPASLQVISGLLATTGPLDAPAWSVQPSPLSKEIKKFLPRAKKQLEEIFYFRNKYDLSLHQARVMWEKRGLLSLWVLQVMPQLLHDDAEGKRSALNLDILLHITRYLFPALQIKSFEDILFKVIRYFLTSSIDHYVSPIGLVSRFSNWLGLEQTPPRLHVERARSFQKEIKLAESKKELARLCIEQSALFNKNNLTDEKGCTTLFYAVANSTPAAVVQELLDYGAAPNIARKSDGETPLNLAVRHGNVKMVALLLDYGANPNQKNKANETAYDIAKLLDQDVAEKIVEILGRPISRRILPAHKEDVNGWEANDPFVEILEHTCARLVM